MLARRFVVGHGLVGVAGSVVVVWWAVMLFELSAAVRPPPMARPSSEGLQAGQGRIGELRKLQGFLTEPGSCGRVVDAPQRVEQRLGSRGRRPARLGEVAVIQARAPSAESHCPSECPGVATHR